MRIVLQVASRASVTVGERVTGEITGPGLVALVGVTHSDTPEIAAEVSGAVAELQAERSGVVWIEQMLPRTELVAVLAASTVFVCPSVYEPLGIVNLEAMACRTAVVASDVGGIPEVVVDGETGTLVHYDADDPETFRREFAAAVNALVADQDRAADMGAKGRQRVIDHFGWHVIAAQTVEVYLQAGAVPGAPTP